MTLVLPFISTDDLYYGTDAAYRAVFRRICNMNLTKTSVGVDTSLLDDVTRDEIAYDEDAVTAFMTAVWKHTKTNADLCELYQCVAGTMFSTDPEIGLAILFSYDYLPMFYPILYSFSQHPEIEVDIHPNYDALLRIFRKH